MEKAVIENKHGQGEAWGQKNTADESREKRNQKKSKKEKKLEKNCRQSASETADLWLNDLAGIIRSGAAAADTTTTALEDAASCKLQAGRRNPKCCYVPRYPSLPCGDSAIEIINPTVGQFPRRELLVENMEKLSHSPESGHDKPIDLSARALLPLTVAVQCTQSSNQSIVPCQNH